MHLDREACYRAMLTRDARFDGRFFTCVRTTGIYCRPICPARVPKLEHVVFLPSAAAAQAAGYRSCLRCRPETSPELAAWHGTASTVARGMAPIAAGALNPADVDSLARRLGIGERQLRRLFAQHLGASPKAVAQTRRVLLAKQLITDTTLPMTEVALASGFGSVRRFNAAIRTLYGRPPRSLRRAAGPDAPAGSAITLTLPYKSPYDWPGMIGFLATRAIPGVERVTGDAYARTIALGEATGTLVVRPAAQAGGSAGHGLVATIRFPDIAALPAIVARIRRIFDLGADPGVIAAHLSEDPHLARLVAARPGLRVPGAWDGFELAMRAVLGQQISVAAATRLAGTLVAALGTPLPASAEPAPPGLTHVFPSAARIAAADLAATLGMPRARIAALHAVAEAALADPGLFEPGRDLEAAVARLCAVRGIGAWTAHYIAMRALREPDAFPTADIGLLRALATPAGRPTPAALQLRAAGWRPWRAYAALHLWAADPGAPVLAQERSHETVARSPAVPARDAAAGL
ncbi:MAG: AlkA N-terminal domain-containing protein [Acetobacteraceae bacterium]|nr:AlkA N-terminal domain-containing protein [Acetobacteraceae bacterium]